MDRKLSSIPHPMSKPFYDVFISHAYEDQNEFAGHLALALKKKGLSVWYSGFELTLGASITASVNEALINSRYGVVLISPVYLTKKWAMKELEALFGQETHANRVLPVLHGMSVDTFREKMPLLADRYTVSSRRGVDYVVTRILQVIKGEAPPLQKKTVKPAKSKKVARRKPAAGGMNIQNAGVIVLGGTAKVENAAGGTINIRKRKK
jgi:hypothetical protein